MSNLVPLLQAAKLFLRVTQHLLHCAVRAKFLSIEPKEVDPDLGILENRTEKLLALPELFLGPLAFSVINNRDDGSSDPSTLKNWKRGIVNRDRGTIATPDHFRIYAATLPLRDCAVDGALIHGIDGTVQLVVVHQFMHVPAQRLLGAVADQFTRSSVEECAVSLQIDPVNALSGRFQQHLHLFRDCFGHFLGLGQLARAVSDLPLQVFCVMAAALLGSRDLTSHGIEAGLKLA